MDSESSDRNLKMVQNQPGIKFSQVPGKLARGTTKAGLGAGAVVVGILLFLVFRGFGSGGTGQSGSSESSGQSADTDDALLEQSPDGSTSPDPGSDSRDTQSRGLADPEDDLTPDERNALSSQVLTVLIDERQYMIQIASTPTPLFRPTTLTRIATLADRTEGDSNGIRVRILRRETSRPSAENELRDVLKTVDINEDSILMPAETVP
jgi:hypothetical protein